LVRLLYPRLLLTKK